MGDEVSQLGKEWHHKEGYNLGAEAQLQAILKAIKGGLNDWGS